MDTFVKCPKGGAFDSLFCLEGRVSVHNDCPGGGFLLPSSRVPGVCSGGGMVLGEIDTCIKCLLLRIQGGLCLLCPGQS